jgi:DNA gyrase subunit B
LAKSHAVVGEKVCGIGLFPVNALSAWCRLDVRREGYHWQQTYREGLSEGPFDRLYPTTETGTAITFRPDPTIIPYAAFDAEELGRWLKELGLELGPVAVSLRDERDEPARVLVLN